MRKDTIKVLVVDDHEMVRLGLISYLETEADITIIGEAETGSCDQILRNPGSRCYINGFNYVTGKRSGSSQTDFK